jgi:hypothetical protein
MIDCESCGRHFTDNAAMEMHFVYGIPVGVGEGAMFKSQAEVAENFPERRRCGNDNELRATCGLKYRGWLSMRGIVNDFWEIGT